MMESLKGPRARTDGLLVEEVDGEVLVYDLESDRAHCLTEAAARVWRLCDGERTLAQIAEAVESDLSDTESIALVGHSLEQLAEAQLLLEADDDDATDRRRAVKRMARVAALTAMMPLVDSIVAPLAAQAASCVSLVDCLNTNPNNCGGLPICENRNFCCTRATRISLCLPRRC